MLESRETEGVNEHFSFHFSLSHDTKCFYNYKFYSCFEFLADGSCSTDSKVFFSVWNWNRNIWNWHFEYLYKVLMGKITFCLLLWNCYWWGRELFLLCIINFSFSSHWLLSEVRVTLFHTFSVNFNKTSLCFNHNKSILKVFLNFIRHFFMGEVK